MAADLLYEQFPRWAMGLAALAGLFVGGLFLVKRSGDRRANVLYSALLTAAALTQLHFLMDLSGAFRYHPHRQYLPLYHTLWLPVLLFFYAKISLYPNYRFRLTDVKHLALPLGQTLWFMAVLAVPDWRHEEGRYFYNPFYGGLEQALFLFFWVFYLFSAYQYLRRHRRQFHRRSLPRILYYVRKLVKGTALLAMAYAVLGLSDFLSYKYLAVDMRSQPWYEAAQSLAFTGLLLWLLAYGIQVLIWGRRLLSGER